MLDREIILHTELGYSLPESYFKREAMILQYIGAVTYEHFKELMDFYAMAPKIPDKYV